MARHAEILRRTIAAPGRRVVSPPPALHQFAHGPNAVGEALAAARAFCAAEGIGACPALALVVEELVMNLVDHGTGAVRGESGATIGMELARDGALVRLTLTDGGLPFDPRAAPPPGALPPERGGGAGLALVAAFSRIELYTRIDGRNHLRLALPIEG